MKFSIFILICFLLISCVQDRILKPTTFMSKEDFINFHVDLSIINASYPYLKGTTVQIDSLYSYHGIDSIIFLENNIYYASKVKTYKEIFEAVKFRIENLQIPDSTNIVSELDFE